MSGALGLLLLYRGLATGRMGLVAPVSAVVCATIPVVVGGALEGFPGVARAAGIGLGLVAVLLIARPAEGVGREGIGLGVVAGLAFGCYLASIGAVTPGHVWVPLIVARGAGVVTIGLAIALARRPWRVPPRSLPLAGLTGLSDVLGNAAFYTAVQSGRLDVAGVLGALYPISTVVLARIVLGERIGRSHLAAIGLAFAAIVLIVAG